MTSNERAAYRVARKYRAELDRLEDKTALELARSFSRMQTAILVDLAVLRKPAASPLSVRYEQNVRSSVERRLTAYISRTDAAMTRLTKRSAAIGVDLAHEAARKVTPKEAQNWPKVSTAGLFSGGLLSAGKDVLSKIPGQVASRLSELAQQAVGMAEQGFEWLMSQVESVLSGAWRSIQRLVRTVAEQIFRRAQRQQREQMPVQQWRRVANHETACLACLMLEGRIYDRSEDFADHPNGRCYIVPVEPGSPEENTGREWLESQDEETQRRIMGKTRFEAWQNGEISLDQMTEVVNDPVYGPQPRMISLERLGLSRGK